MILKIYNSIINFLNVLIDPRYVSVLGLLGFLLITYSIFRLIKPFISSEKNKKIDLVGIIVLFIGFSLQVLEKIIEVIFPNKFFLQGMTFGSYFLFLIIFIIIEFWIIKKILKKKRFYKKIKIKDKTKIRNKINLKEIKISEKTKEKILINSLRVFIISSLLGFILPLIAFWITSPNDEIYFKWVTWIFGSIVIITGILMLIFKKITRKKIDLKSLVKISLRFFKEFL